MKEDPQADLHDAAEFFRRGDEGDYVDSESRPAGRRASAEDVALFDDALPDPELVEAQLIRRARYTRWVAGFMGTLSVGCLVLVATHGFASRPVAPLDTVRTPPVPKLTRVAQDIHGLRRTDVMAGDGSHSEKSELSAVAQAAPPETAQPPSGATAPPAARANLARAIVPSRVQAPTRPGEQAQVQAPTRPGTEASQPGVLQQTAEVAPQHTPIASFPASEASQPTGVQRAAQDDAANSRIPAVVVSHAKMDSRNRDYQPPTAQFAD